VKCNRVLAALCVVLGLATAAPAFAADKDRTDPIGDLIENAAKAIQKFATDMSLRATFYHAGARGVGSRDSLGCQVVSMRTLAVDPRIIPKHSIVFIAETVGLILPDGTAHDGLWYASDTGGAIKGSKVDLYTGTGAASMKQFFEKKLNTAVLNAVKVGTFTGCPPR
jgi:3D (Asp-Asp-Asp) domain-containing protein